MIFYSDNKINPTFKRFNSIFFIFSSFVILLLLLATLLINTSNNFSIISLFENTNLLILSTSIITISALGLILLINYLINNNSLLSKIEYFLDQNFFGYLIILVLFFGFHFVNAFLYGEHLLNLSPFPSIIDILFPIFMLMISYIFLLLSLINQLNEFLKNKKVIKKFHDFTFQMDYTKDSKVFSFLEYKANRSVFYELQNINKVSSLVDKTQAQDLNEIRQFFIGDFAKNIKQIKIIKLPIQNNNDINSASNLRVFLQVVFEHSKYKQSNKDDIYAFEKGIIKKLNESGFKIKPIDVALTTLVFISQFSKQVAKSLLLEILEYSSEIRLISYNFEGQPSLDRLQKISNRLSSIIDIFITGSNSESIRLKFDKANNNSVQSEQSFSIHSSLYHSATLRYPMYEKSTDTLILEFNPINDIFFDNKKHNKIFNRLKRNFKKTALLNLNLTKDDEKNLNQTFSNKIDFNKKSDYAFNAIKNNKIDFVSHRKYIIKKAKQGSGHKFIQIPSFYGSNHYGEQLNVLNDILECEQKFSYYEPVSVILEKKQINQLAYEVFTEDNLIENDYVSSLPIGVTLNVGDKSERYPAYLDLGTYRYKIPNKDRLNPHTILLGKSGSGKSTLIKQILISRAKQVNKLFVFDVKQGEFDEPLTYLQNLSDNPYRKQDIIFSTSSLKKLNINPFAIHGSFKTYEEL